MGYRTSKPVLFLSILLIACMVYVTFSSDSFFNRKNRESCDQDSCKPKNNQESTDVYGEEMDEEGVNVFVTFTNVKNNIKLHEKLKVMTRSLMEHASVPVSLYIIGDEESQKLAPKIVLEGLPDKTKMLKFTLLDIESIVNKVDDTISTMMTLFSSKPGQHYGLKLFFLSIAIHKILPDKKKIIMLDADLKFKDDIKDLHDLFNDFNDDQLIGIGHDLQPVYRHTFWKFRQDHPGTRVGEPAPGLQGFNSGVLLLNLERMRNSVLYNSLIEKKNVVALTEEYSFKGHLGDQDFFTVAGMKHPELFYVLPCGWNRQLCRYWEQGYRDVFEEYYKCEGPVHIYHGNCNTPFPDD